MLFHDGNTLIFMWNDRSGDTLTLMRVSEGLERTTLLSARNSAALHPAMAKAVREHFGSIGWLGYLQAPDTLALQADWPQPGDTDYQVVFPEVGEDVIRLRALIETMIEQVTMAAGGEYTGTVYPDQTEAAGVMAELWHVDAKYNVYAEWLNEDQRSDTLVFMAAPCGEWFLRSDADDWSVLHVQVGNRSVDAIYELLTSVLLDRMHQHRDTYAARRHQQSA
jgi:hypothetical protein